MPEQYIPVESVCEKYSLSRRTVHRYITKGLLTGYRVGPRLVRLDPDEVERVLGGQPMGPDGGAE